MTPHPTPQNQGAAKGEQPSQGAGKHTPGPWTIGWNGNGTKSVMAGGEPVAYPVIPSVNPYHVALDIAEANAHLIAAAPDMLEALKDIVEQLKKGRFLNEYGDAMGLFAMEQVHAAIAKAEGR